MAAAQAPRYEKIARECVRKKDERGEQIVIALDGRKRDRPFKDEEFECIAQYLPDAVKDLAAASGRSGRLVQVCICGGGGGALTAVTVVFAHSCNWDF